MGTRKPAWILAVAVGILMLSSTVEAQSTRLVYSSEEAGFGLDVFKMPELGVPRIRMTFDPASLRPSISPDSRRIVYDHAGGIFIVNADGTGTAQELIPNSEEAIWEVAEDADAGRPTGLYPAADFMVVFVGEYVDHEEIFLATVDVSANELINVHQLTDAAPGCANPPCAADCPSPPCCVTGPCISYQPAWCGNSHVVWSRELPVVDVESLYFWELCVMPVSKDGPTGPATCRVTDHTADQYPSCNPAGTKIAFAQSVGDVRVGAELFELPHEICTVDFDPEGTTPGTMFPGEVLCTFNAADPTNLLDDNKPVWSPSGTALAFASNRDGGGYYDIWFINHDVQTGLIQKTFNDVTETDPEWGGALLP